MTGKLPLQDRHRIEVQEPALPAEFQGPRAAVSGIRSGSLPQQHAFAGRTFLHAQGHAGCRRRPCRFHDILDAKAQEGESTRAPVADQWQRGDIALGVLNLGDTDYHLNPLNSYAELPHERVFTARLRLRF